MGKNAKYGGRRTQETASETKGNEAAAADKQCKTIC